MGQEHAGKSLATLLPPAKLTRLPPWVPVARDGSRSRKPTCFFAGCGPLFRPTMDDTPAKETPGEGLNKIDLSQLQDFRFGTQWTEIKSVPGQRREPEGDRPPVATAVGGATADRVAAGAASRGGIGACFNVREERVLARWRPVRPRAAQVAKQAQPAGRPGTNALRRVSGAGDRRNVRVVASADGRARAPRRITGPI